MSYKQDGDVWKIAMQCMYVGPLVHCIDRNLYLLVLKHSTDCLETVLHLETTPIIYLLITGSSNVARQPVPDVVPQSVFTVRDVIRMNLNEKDYTVSVTDAPSPTDIMVQVVTEDNVTNLSAIDALLAKLFSEYSGKLLIHS